MVQQKLKTTTFKYIVAKITLYVTVRLGEERETWQITVSSNFFLCQRAARLQESQTKYGFRATSRLHMYGGALYCKDI